MAILVAVGFKLLIEWLGSRRRSPVALEIAAAPARPGRLSGGLVVPLVTALAVVLAVTPGLAWYARFAARATFDLPAIQDDFADLVPAGTVVAGPSSATYLMKSEAITVIFGSAAGPANDGDLYARGVRWYLMPVGAATPNGVPADAWSGRRQVACGTYGGATQCLYQLP
jgi:hypothetical protein